MIINRWIGTDVDIMQNLSQEYRHPSDWPYSPDWIVDFLSWDTTRQQYWIRGHYPDGKEFSYALYADRPLSWRYVLDNAKLQIGRHETETESRTRYCQERRQLVSAE